MPSLTADVLSPLAIVSDGWVLATGRGGVSAFSFQLGPGELEEFIERFPADPEYAAEFEVEDWTQHRLTRTLSVSALDGRLWIYRDSHWGQDIEESAGLYAVNPSE